MLDKDLYSSWKSRIELYKKNREHERMILESVEHSPLIWPMIEENEETNIILQSLSSDIYLLFNHQRVAKDLWERIQLLMQCFAVLVFSPGDDPIACLNKAMAFLTAVASSRVTVQQVQGRQGQSYSGTGYKSNATSSEGNNLSRHARVVKCYNCQGEGHMARQCSMPKRPRHAAWYKEKAMLAEAQDAGQILDEEQLACHSDPGVPDGQEIIVNGDSPPLKRSFDGVEQTYPPTTAEEKLARKNELKARDGYVNHERQKIPKEDWEE
nr:hypothetical protein [Tanacetum cinerariifolium]